MDRETLSHYGWIVILVLILAVLLAFATPFGSFIADGFKATYAGFDMVGNGAMNNILDATGLSDKLECGHKPNNPGDHSKKDCGHYNCDEDDCGCVPAECEIEGHYTNDGRGPHGIAVKKNENCFSGHKYTCQCENGWQVPVGGTYYTGFNQIQANPEDAKQTYEEGQYLPCGYKPRIFDLYKQGDYIYDLNTYAENTQHGWGVRVLDKNKTSYGDILSSICDRPVSSMRSTFENCKNLTIEGVPKLPDSVIHVACLFRYCSSITTTEGFNLPPNIKSAYGIFEECKNLVDASNIIIPKHVEDAARMFYQCNKLKYAPDLSKATGLKTMSYMFVCCYALEECPTVPNGVTCLECTFGGCDGLTDLSEFIIPESVDDMRFTFEGCDNLTHAPRVPSKVEWLHFTFNGCEKIQGYIDVPCIINPHNDGYYSGTLRYYHVDDCNETICEHHTGGTATCLSLAKCDSCNAEYGSYAQHQENNGVCTTCGIEVTIIESAHNPYPNNQNNITLGTWDYTGAKSVTITITYQTENTNCDWIYLKSGDNYIDLNGNITSSATKIGGTTKTTKTFTTTALIGSAIFRTDGSSNNYHGVEIAISPNY